MAQSIFPSSDLASRIREIRQRLVEDSLAEIDDPKSRLWNDVLPEILPALTRLAFRQVVPSAGERELLLRLRAALKRCDDNARRERALTAVHLFY